MDTRPTALLVHDAFTDASSFAPVIRELGRWAWAARAPMNPLRSLEGDAEAVARYATTITGPIVLVGHGYGGAVARLAAPAIPAVRHIVQLSGFVLKTGESCAEVRDRGAMPEDRDALITSRYEAPLAEPAHDMFILIPRFRATWGSSLPEEEAAARAVSQRPISSAAFEGPMPAVESVWPSSYLVAGDDVLIRPDAQRRMSARVLGQVETVSAPHAVPLTHPSEVARFIEQALLTSSD